MNVVRKGRVEGRVAFITGAGRGQGRSHALRLAEEGADIIAVDICAPVASVRYPMSTKEDLAETARLVRERDRRVVTAVADVRDAADIEAALRQGVDELGRLDIVVANAGIASYAPAHEITEQAWKEMIDINLTGVWQTCKAAVRYLLPQRSGSIVIISSGAGLIAPPNLAHYVSAKHGTVGLMRALSNELAPHMIRVNSIHPTQVDTPMIMHEEIYRMFRPDLENPTREDIVEPSTAMNSMPVPWVDPVDVSNAVLFLASDEARYITGATLPVDAGIVTKV
ncbi:(-)-trans-carveol dehydrogenase [Frankia canadensis]|uniref:(-)-trans-carveol dehydrogenase n=1 Tax=Frankia canadensis TaxID=1836972 RepID=A0A2I2KJU9_9ACTN|nr:mycofactocin-coupled SDR family oxidoreductase [Frankia canadensis]SNQ45935.1 (-)-trans-carveol dehydrogenase [Frankia canadensis]SOU53225.1 (-)-trans-carveol dehydrogenase [Frankia canadensis]